MNVSYEEYKDIMRQWFYSLKSVFLEKIFDGLDCIILCETNKDYSDMQEYKSKTDFILI